ncbi:MAG: hypothetical protein GX781_05540 [Clostridiales bacterium]|nr:hypothetical protein [Clostridiales bacterium]
MKQKKHLFLLIFILIIFSLNAAAEVIKSEIVYAKLTAEGEVEHLFVVNGFESDQQSQVVDYGKYREVQQLGMAQEFSYEDDAVRFNVQPGRFFYEGIPDDLRLPWQITLKYRLDGEEITPQALLGENGQLEIILNIKPEKGFEAYTEAITLQATLTLDGDHSFHVTSEKATMAWAGGNIQLSFILLPGQEATYTVNTAIKNFQTLDLQAAGIKMAMDTQMYKDVAKKALAGSPLENAVGGLMENFLKAMQGGSSPSFMDERNQTDSLQFVMMLQGIPIPQQEPEEIKTQEDTKTVWDRLKDLVGL